MTVMRAPVNLSRLRFHPESESQDRRAARERLRSVLTDGGDDSLFELKQRVLAALRLHTGGTLGHDDVTMMAVKVN